MKAGDQSKQHFLTSLLWQLFTLTRLSGPSSSLKGRDLARFWALFSAQKSRKRNFLEATKQDLAIWHSGAWLQGLINRKIGAKKCEKMATLAFLAVVTLVPTWINVSLFGWILEEVAQVYSIFAFHKERTKTPSWKCHFFWAFFRSKKDP